LIFHVATTNASAWSLKVDNVVVTPSKYVYGTPITDWVSYTPQLLGSITNPTIGPDGFVDGKWRRLGDSVEIQARAYRGTSGGSAGSGTYYLTLPTGMTANFQKISTRANLGVGYTLDSLVLNYTGTAWLDPDGQRITVQLGQVGDLLRHDVPSVNWWTSTGNNGFEINATIPIQGWSSSVRMSDGYEGRQVIFIGGVTTQTIATGTLEVPKILTPPVVRDTCACYNPSTGVFKAPSSEFYRISARVACLLEPNAFLRIGYSINSTSNFTKLSAKKNETTVNETLFGSIDDVVYLTAGDEIRFGVSHDNSTNTQLPGDSRLQAFSIERISSPQTIAMGEVVAGFAKNTSGQVIPTDTVTTITNWTVTSDTHGIFNPTTGVLTVNRSGFLDISAMVFYNVDPNGDRSALLYLNGSELSAVDSRASNIWGTGVPIAISGYPVKSGDTITLRGAQGSGGNLGLLNRTYLSWRIY
jgi:hypothetical protein